MTAPSTTDISRDADELAVRWTVVIPKEAVR